MDFTLQAAIGMAPSARPYVRSASQTGAAARHVASARTSAITAPISAH